MVIISSMKGTSPSSSDDKPKLDVDVVADVP
eukprot:CAMPEP_0171008806 /NCGR_PEP_ID=MMETSP0736-20130129/20843_1 /TAXON_ID=186038 /ORGANISM="Fragilariopsis kerguelensis, Strain L26-C5" /LENGTH=30 /DNA_ID= /DNA_START= /DNA_END= /DNA_ORIENTATION=